MQLKPRRGQLVAVRMYLGLVVRHEVVSGVTCSHELSMPSWGQLNGSFETECPTGRLGAVEGHSAMADVDNR